jgi:exosome complex component RRP43
MAAAAALDAAAAAAAAPEAEAFRRIYPQEYLERFLAAGTRADERPLGRARAARCGAAAAPCAAPHAAAQP